MEQWNQQNYQNIEQEQHVKKGCAGRFGLLVIILLGVFYVVGKLGDSKSEEAGDIFSDRVYHMNDDSALYLYDDGTYYWYQNNEVKNDNYYTGTFKVYNAGAAEDHIVNDLSEYGIEKEELQEIYQRNSESKLYAKENFYCLVMNCNLRFVDGEENTDGVTETPYFGFSDGKDYDLANMNTGNYLQINDIEPIEGE